MRLLDTASLELVEILGETEPYAILSHTWGKEEVSFQEIQYITQDPSTVAAQRVNAVKAKAGYNKIKRAAALAYEHGHRYIWIDTCCIDKTSSAELSEAINSMYHWYTRAKICYAYLEDVTSHHGGNGEFHNLCKKSRWFTRGWTLQELIAPNDVMFYGGSWELLGSKCDSESTRRSLATITGIDLRVLEGVITPSEMSVAARMKWASKRNTTRVEDIAYCLMGLFDVNMPLLYGEGPKAFIRLQEEILKGSNDHTIFAWEQQPTIEAANHIYGLLAASPADFLTTADYQPLPPPISRGSIAWATTNFGLQISLFLWPVVDQDMYEDEYEAVLECTRRRGDFWSESPTIRVKRLYGDQFARVDAHRTRVVPTPSFGQELNTRGSYEVIFVKQNPVHAIPWLVVSLQNICGESKPEPSDVCMEEVWPEKCWNPESASLQLLALRNKVVLGMFRFRCEQIQFSLDCMVGLRRIAGGTGTGTWGYWTSQRPSNTACSITTAVQEFFHHKIIEKNEMPEEWGNETESCSEITVHIRPVHMHGRLYFSVKAFLTA